VWINKHVIRPTPFLTLVLIRARFVRA
jgi:hypothetical protein